MQSWSEELISDYRKNIRDLKKYREGLNMDTATDKEDHRIVGEMISDLRYAIDWMRTGRRPGSRRGVERRSAYQNTTLMDPFLIQSYGPSTENNYFWDSDEKECCLSFCEQVNIEELLSCLTDIEREIYLMKKGNDLSLQKIADERGVSKASVSATIKRADKKLAKQVESMKELESWNTYNQ